MNKLCLLVCCICVIWEAYGKCDVSLHFQFVFGPNPNRAKNMKPEELFYTQLQVDLAKAAAKGDTNRVRTLLRQGVDVNVEGSKGMRPLFWALINENYQGFKFLLDSGADPNAAVSIQQPPPENALTLAASLEDPRYVEELLKHGAIPDSAVGNPSKKTAIFTASFYRQTNNISILLKHGAQIDWQTTSGATPLQEAIERRSFEMALFLLRAGANPMIKDKWGYSSLDTLKKFKDNGVQSRRDEAAYKQLLKELKERNFL